MNPTAETKPKAKAKKHGRLAVTIAIGELVHLFDAGDRLVASIRLDQVFASDQAIKLSIAGRSGAMTGLVYLHREAKVSRGGDLIATISPQLLRGSEARLAFMCPREIQIVRGELCHG